MRIYNLNPISVNCKRNSKTELSRKKFVDSNLYRTSSFVHREMPLIHFGLFQAQNSFTKTILPDILRKTNDEIYIIKLFNKAKQEVQAFLRYSPVKDWEDCNYLAVYDHKGEILGDVHLSFTSWDKSMHLPTNHVRLFELQSYQNDQYSKIGSTLIQAAIEQSLKAGAEGRIYVCSSNIFDRKNDPFIFYNKMGLTIESPYYKSKTFSPLKYLQHLKTGEKEIMIKKAESPDFQKLPIDGQILDIYKTIAALRGRRLDEISLDFFEYMFLHEDKVRGFWLPKIQANSIFSPSTRLQ